MNERTLKDIALITKEITKKLDGYSDRVRVENLPKSAAFKIQEELKAHNVESIVVTDQSEQRGDIMRLRNSGGERVAFLYTMMMGYYVMSEITSTTELVKPSKAMQTRLDKLAFQE